ncbi:hypothetical protein glysoja_023031 [Glycine soja]|nr:hypothetical protein glysoja_023031 [Glycine soja]
MKSGATQYLEFKEIDKSFVYEVNAGLANVPNFRGAIFRDKKLSLKEKNQLMRFFKLVQHNHGTAVTMSVSLEALAMAGASDVEFAMDIEEWERKDLEQYPPPHLLAHEKEGNNGVYGLPTTHFLPNHNTWEYDKEEEHGVTFTHHKKKLDRTTETIWSEFTR